MPSITTESAHAAPDTAAGVPASAQSQYGYDDIAWLGGKPPDELSGTVFGAPWPRGTVTPGERFTLMSQSNGPGIPTQSWPLAYWPDGSLKWTAHAIGSSPPIAGSSSFKLVKAEKSPASETSLSIVETAAQILVDTGPLTVAVPRSGANFVESIACGGKTVLRAARLVATIAGDPDLVTSQPGESFTSAIDSAVVEQNGPIRSVVKIEGRHASANRKLLPFTLRLVFFAGSDSVKLFHTFIYDGDEQSDFLQGLGVRFDVPLSDPLVDRHIRFTGQDGGVWGESVRSITGLRRKPPAEAMAGQVAGQPVAQQVLGGRINLDYVPAWSDFSLSQLSADGFELRKRTKSGYGWVKSIAGRRASGIGYVGGATGGGVAFGQRFFFERYPTQIDIRNAAGDLAEATLWLHSPLAPPLDMRFYHDGLGLDTYAEQDAAMDVTYEDFEPGWGTPHGIARTNEIVLWAVPETPARERFAAMADSLNDPPQLVCRPERYVNSKIFSNYVGLPDLTHPVKKAIENQLTYLLDLYVTMPDERGWYGFWDHGDVMHSYDAYRHEWAYDIGGYGWDNSELSPDLWLWLSFLRTGRADVYRLAEAMTRHTGEVDVYHLGRFQGYGSRHNVQHWGDSSKQPRISTAAYRRIFYYVSGGDERVGDLMRELIDSDERILTIDIGRKLTPETSSARGNVPGVGFGTDWGAFVAAWLTDWERTGNVEWRDRIAAGMRTIGGMRNGWFTGAAPFDLATGRFLGPGDDLGISHLSAVFGGFEMNAEIISLIDVPEYKKTWLEYCDAFNAPESRRTEIIGRPIPQKMFNLGQAHSRLTAYVGVERNDPALIARAWSEFFAAAAGVPVKTNPTLNLIAGPDVLDPVHEAFFMSTNASSQFGLAAIEDLALIGSYIPSELPNTAAMNGDAGA